MYVKTEFGALVNLDLANGVYVSRKDAPMGCERIIADFGNPEDNYTLAAYEKRDDALFAITVLAQYMRDKADVASMNEIRLIVITEDDEEEEYE